MPNPWNAGSARVLARAGFSAVATTSAGFAWDEGLPDGDWALPVDTVLAKIAAIVAAVDLPVNADFESGYARDADGVAANVRRCVDTGVAGLSIEDATGDASAPLFDLPVAIERLRAARAAIDASGQDVLLTGRAECYLVRHPDAQRECLRRLVAYAEAGADVLYAPGVSRSVDIAEIVAAVAPRPVNVLQSAPGRRVEDLAELGVRRISVGSGLAKLAWGPFMRATRVLAERGSFDIFEGAMPFSEINGFFRS